MMQDNHIFQGLKRATHPIKQDKNFLWDAHNIRLTTREGETMLSITNEKSTKLIFSFEAGETYIGHIVIGDYLVVFTHGRHDTIYRINLIDMQKVILYRGDDLNFDASYPAQLIADYESELVQKVYWTDSRNGPRVINISKPELLESGKLDDYSSVYKDHPFGFVQALTLNEKVNVSRLTNGNGIFPSGVIQYVITYYYKYGQESNIVYTSEPLYISHKDRGGSPEDRISTAFEISVEGLQEGFDYLRIYSIIRTSIDATPTVKRVTDIELSNSKSIKYIDDGISGDIVDPTSLLYVGGKDIIAGCISSKDNTLFLGDIQYIREEVSEIDVNGTKLDEIYALSSEERNKVVSITDSSRIVELPIDGTSSSFYSYSNQLSKNTSTFKNGECYRLGLQFQHKSGEWSQPIFIEDKTLMSSKPDINGKTLTLPTFKGILSANIITSLAQKGYKKVRPLVVLPGNKDKNILAQGLVCPTVFNVGSRDSNSPFSQSSWLLRPFLNIVPTTNKPNDMVNTGPNALVADKGAIVEYRHLMPLLSGLDRGAEIQNMFFDTGSESETKYNNSDIWDHNLSDTSNALTNPIESNTAYRALYYVDQSILTFHSPDIEFNDEMLSSINNTPLKVRLVGVVPFSSNAGDILIQESSPVIDPDASGFIHRSIVNTSEGSRSLVSGLFYEDAYVDDGKNAATFYRADSINPWLIHMWHRTGSLNNDSVRPNGTGERTAVLKKKIISNLKFSNRTVWFNTPPEEANLKASNIQVFNSNEVEVIKLKDSHNYKGDITYYGNVDSLSPSYSKYRIVLGEGWAWELKNPESVFNGSINSGEGRRTAFNGLRVGGLTGNISSGNVVGIVISGPNITVDIVEAKETESGDVIYETVTKSISPVGGTFNITIIGQKYTGSLTINGNTFGVEGTTTYEPQYEKNGGKQVSFNFNASLKTVDPSQGHIGKELESLKLPKDPVRIKYKSTPHVVFSMDYNGTVRQPIPVLKNTPTSVINGSSMFWSSSDGAATSHEILLGSLGLSTLPNSYLWLAELTQDVLDENRFGGKTKEAIQSNLWIPAGLAVGLNESIEWRWGDTWYQRYDCLKTYPFSDDDINQVIEIGSFMCESRVNIDGRYDRNRGGISNLHISPRNFNLMNPVYSQKNTFFNYRVLDKDYFKINTYPSQFIWTGVKSPSAIQDTWTNLHLANTMDMDGSNGRLVSIIAFNDLLLGFQERAVSQILFNNRVQIQASDGVPIEIANSQKVEGVRAYSNTIGCQDKFNIITTSSGVYFIDNNNSTVYLFNGQLSNLGLQLGNLYWFRDNHQDNSWMFTSNKEGNPGIRLYYDSKYQDVYFVPSYTYLDNNIEPSNETLCYSEQLGQFTSMLSYNGAVMFPYSSRLYSLANDTNGNLSLWENFKGEGYNVLFGVPREFNFSFISNDNPNITKIFDTIEMRADKYSNNKLLGDKYTTTVQEGQPFNFIRVNNEYQDTGKVLFNASSLRKKFRVWRAIVPRKVNTMERIRNPWTKITLGNDNLSNFDLTILHDLSVNYTI